MRQIVLDTETTGLDPSWHEIIQLAIVPLDTEFNVRKDTMPLNINIKPEYPERAEPEAMKKNKLDINELLIHGFDRDAAADLVKDYVDKMDLPYTASGAYRKRLIPLGQNVGFDIAFMKNWLGVTEYSELFDYHHKDTVVIAQFLNDLAAFHGIPTPFPKVNLTYLCSTLGISYKNAHDAFADCMATAEVYRRLLKKAQFLVTP